MGVIYLPSWRVYSFVDDDGINILFRWMEREDVSLPDRQVLWQRLLLLETVGPHALPNAILPLEDEFYYLNVKARKESLVMTPVLCYGPFYSDRELTILAGSPIEKGVLGPNEVLPIARRNLDTLRRDKGRRVMHERYNNRPA